MAHLIRELTTDFSSGMFDSVASTNYPKAAVAQIVNGRIQPDGTVRRRWGSIRTHAAALGDGPSYGGTEFITAAGVVQVIKIFGSQAFKSEDYGATWTQIATGLRRDYYTFATMRVGASIYLYAANSDTTVKRWDGTTWDTNPNAPSGVKFVAVFNGRLWYAGHSGVIVQATAIADPTILATPNGLLVQIIVSDGDDLTGLYQVGPHLLVFDRHQTSYIDGYGEQTLIVAVGATGFSRSVGCLAFRSIVGVGENAVCWLSQRGVEYYSVNTGIQLISKSVQLLVQTIAWDQVLATPGAPCGAYDPINQNYHLAISTTGQRNNNTLVFNLLDNVQYQRPGKRAAVSVDRQNSQSGSIAFGGDANGYLTSQPGGLAARVGADGYMQLAATGDPVSGDAGGYLSTLVDDTLPSTIFMSQVAGGGAPVVYLGGYDGFVRRQYAANTDDTLSDGTGGNLVTLSLVSRPFLAGAPQQRKRVRGIHVAAIADSTITITALIRAEGSSIAQRTFQIPATAYSQARRHRPPIRVNAVADAPQVELQTTDDARLVLVGVSSDLMREPL